MASITYFGTYSRRARAAIFAVVWLFASPLASAAELPTASDFRADAAVAKERALPILVFFSSHDCAYCHIVQSDYLEPMFNSGAYADKILFRTVNIEEETRLRDFAGKLTTHQQFASEEGARLTPYVKLFDPDGRELVPGLRGLMTQDFYGGMLESAIDEAYAKMRARAGRSVRRRS